MQNRRTVLQALTATGLSAYLVQAVSMGTKPLAPGIRSIKGTVSLNGSPAKEGQLVLPGDSIATGKASEVIYVMGNNAYLMREDSSANFVLDGAIGVLRVITGKVLGVFGPGSKRIVTSTATIGIRGTACYLETTDTQTYFCLCYGAAEITPTADVAQARSVVTRYHDSPFYIGADASTSLLKPAPVINHRDVELTMLEALVGRQPPFAAQGGSSGY
jgi:hypothetical protein